MLMMVAVTALVALALITQAGVVAMPQVHRSC
jgi:hypothetical protein